jgi:hypothetical protein
VVVWWFCVWTGWNGVDGPIQQHRITYNTSELSAPYRRPTGQKRCLLLAPLWLLGLR